MTNVITKSIFIAGAAGMLALAACGGGGDKTKAARQNTPTPVTLQEVQLQPTSYYDEYPGTTVALSQVELRAQVSGYITGIFFKEGEHVRKGRKLYEIDRSKYQASYTQAQANLTQARANQDRAQKDADRYIYLSKQDAIAKQVLDHALTDLQNAKAAVSNVNAALVSAQADLNFATITAPFDGTIGLSQVKAGTLVSIGQTLLNTISTDDPVAVDFVVNEKEIPRFTRIEQLRNVPDTDSLFTIKLADASLYHATGSISVLDRAVDPQTGTIRVRLVFPNKEGALKSGMSCTVRVHNQDAKEQMLIPNKATLEQMGEYFVFVAKDTVIAEADPAKKDDKATGKPQLAAQQKKVVLGQVIGAGVVVKSGLQPGDKIIVDGIQKLRDGAPVTAAVPPGPQQGGQGGNGGKSSSQNPAAGGTTR